MTYLLACDTSSEPANTNNAISLEFEQHWECTSDINEDDMDCIKEDMAHWWGSHELVTSRNR